MREGDYLEDLGVDGKIILKWFFKKYDGDVKWIDPALVKTVTNFWVSYNEGNFLTNRGRTSF